MIVNLYAGQRVGLVPYDELVEEGRIRSGEDLIQGLDQETYKGLESGLYIVVDLYTGGPFKEAKVTNGDRKWILPIWTLREVRCVRVTQQPPLGGAQSKTPETWGFAEEVTVLGTKYRIIQSTEDEEPRLEGLNGFTDWTSKKIVVRGRDVDGNLDDLEAYAKKTLRHEIVHAFLQESGLSCCTSAAEPWAESEELVDWIAWQGPKLVGAWREAGCLGK